KRKKPIKSNKPILITLITLILFFILILILFFFFFFFSTSPQLNQTHKDDQLDWKSSSPQPIPSIKNLFGLRSPKIGTNEWKSLYPSSSPSGPIPQPQWISRYHHLRNHSSNLLSYTFTVPQANLSHTTGLAIYPIETNLGSDVNGGICSFRRTSCLRGVQEDHGMGLEDLWIGRPGTWSINFDDGPLPPSESLYKFLSIQNQSATHFWIGSNVRDHVRLALEAYKRDDHLAVHTWSHAHLTTLDDYGILGELGWTIQVIFDLTGVIPLFYRPPYGDVDNRVRAIAKVNWSLNQTYAIGDYIDPPMKGFGIEESVRQIRSHLQSDRVKSNPIEEREGMMILEHELSEESVKVFELSFDEVKKEGYRTCNVADCLGSDWYQ
ncbi:family 4 carbohydrate esterase, partial [Melampsora americana]